MAENPEDRQEASAAEAVQMMRQLSTLYRWVAPDVLGAPPILSQAYLDELKETGVIFDGGELERRYKVEAARRGERVCFMNLDHPTKPCWLWVNEVMFTEFGIRVPFSDFQPFFQNIAGWGPSALLAELRRGWSVSVLLDRKAGFDVAPVTYKGLRAHQKDAVNVLTTLVAKNNLAPKVLLGRPEDARRDVVSMAGNDDTLNRLRGLVHPSPSVGATIPNTPLVVHTGPGLSSTARSSTQPVGSTPNVIITPEGGGFE
ncbi:hypothetical protein PIB30_072012 [Stylosanthes scabra]|uniref:Uncharacterized protein n=1 Tax=Stylosanthes scabra TaxID=79078 RepID=A0ABU6TNQ3_9FABA|nr:hypothetical protein [Stylosanthes scabra]